jgi:hypothetical protein
MESAVKPGLFRPENPDQVALLVKSMGADTRDRGIFPAFSKPGFLTP